DADTVCVCVSKCLCPSVCVPSVCVCVSKRVCVRVPSVCVSKCVCVCISKPACIFLWKYKLWQCISTSASQSVGRAPLVGRRDVAGGARMDTMNNNYILRFNELTQFIEFKHK